MKGNIIIIYITWRKIVCVKQTSLFQTIYKSIITILFKLHLFLKFETQFNSWLRIIFFFIILF